MRVSLFTEYGALNSAPIFSAFAEGCDEEIVYNDMDADVAVIWSVLFAGRMAGNKKVWDHFKKRDRPIIVLEVGALKRNETWKVGIGGINNHANFGNRENFIQGRWDKFGIELKPYIEDGQFITIPTQRADSHQWSGMPATSVWLGNAIENIRKFSKRDIVIRPHPRDGLTDYNQISRDNAGVYFDIPERTGVGDAVNFDDILSRSWLVVNHSSGPGIQAAFNGTHIFTGTASMAYPLSVRSWDNIENPPRVDRARWVKELAHTEWWVDEIAEGIPWKRLKNYIW